MVEILYTGNCLQFVKENNKLRLINLDENPSNHVKLVFVKNKTSVSNEVDTNEIGNEINNLTVEISISSCVFAEAKSMIETINDYEIERIKVKEELLKLFNAI